MRRLPALGTAVLFVVTLGFTAQVSADPIKIEAGASQLSKIELTPLNLSGSGYFLNGRDRDIDAPGLFIKETGSYTLNHSFSEKGSLITRGAGFDRLWLDGHFAVSGGLPSASSSRPSSGSSEKPQSASAPAASESRAANAAAGAPAAEAAKSNASAQPAVAGGSPLVPTAVSTSFANAESVVTPEPATMILLGSGLAFAGLGAKLRRRRRS